MTTKMAISIKVKFCKLVGRKENKNNCRTYGV